MRQQRIAFRIQHHACHQHAINQPDDQLDDLRSPGRPDEPAGRLGNSAKSERQHVDFHAEICFLRFFPQPAPAELPPAAFKHFRKTEQFKDPAHQHQNSAVPQRQTGRQRQQAADHRAQKTDAGDQKRADFADPEGHQHPRRA